MRIRDWSADVCSSDLVVHDRRAAVHYHHDLQAVVEGEADGIEDLGLGRGQEGGGQEGESGRQKDGERAGKRSAQQGRAARSEEHTSELQSLMRISYAFFSMKKKHHVVSSITHII